MEVVKREKITWSKFFSDFYNMFCGKDGKLSIRRVLGAAAFLGVLRTVEAGISGKLVPEFYFMGLIILTLGFFGMTTWSSNTYFNKNKTDE